MGGVKDEIMGLFKTNTTKDFSKPTCINNIHMVLERNKVN